MTLDAYDIKDMCETMGSIARMKFTLSGGGGGNTFRIIDATSMLHKVGFLDHVIFAEELNTAIAPIIRRYVEAGQKELQKVTQELVPYLASEQQAQKTK